MFNKLEADLRSLESSSISVFWSAVATSFGGQATLVNRSPSINAIGVFILSLKSSDFNKNSSFQYVPTNLGLMSWTMDINTGVKSFACYSAYFVCTSSMAFNKYSSRDILKSMLTAKMAILHCLLLVLPNSASYVLWINHRCAALPPLLLT